MPLIWLLVTGLSGVIAGAQLDNAVQSKFQPVGSDSGTKLPLIFWIVALVALSAAAFFLVRKVLK